MLSEVQQMVLRRLAISPMALRLQPPARWPQMRPHPESEIMDHLAALVARSLVVADLGHAEPRLRLLETTRAYELTKPAESSESDLIARRLAEYCRDFLEVTAQQDGAADD